jgi:hypothetical protein
MVEVVSKHETSKRRRVWRLLFASFSSGLSFDTKNVPPKRRTLSELRGVTAQTTVLFNTIQVTDFWISRWFTLDDCSEMCLLHSVYVSRFADVAEVHSASTYIRNVGDTAYVQTV